MYLKKLSLINFKNIREENLEFRPGINCFVGDNGAGKTNVIDAVYFLSMCKSSLAMTDGQNMRHGSDFFLLDGQYLTDEGRSESVVCAFARKGGKTLKRNGKEYERLSDHVGLIPVVIVSPADTMLISDAADERRRYLNGFISQLDRAYLQALVRYNAVLGERNRLLKISRDEQMLCIYDRQLVEQGGIIHRKRSEIAALLEPEVARYYRHLSSDREQVTLEYRSELNDTPFEELLLKSREKDFVNGFTTAGIHRDDLVLHIGGYPLRKYGSQGQQKSFLIALKLAQYALVAQAKGEKPILLLDDLFDKLDCHSVSNSSCTRLSRPFRYSQPSRHSKPVDARYSSGEACLATLALLALRPRLKTASSSSVKSGSNSCSSRNCARAETYLTFSALSFPADRRWCSTSRCRTRSSSTLSPTKASASGLSSRGSIFSGSFIERFSFHQRPCPLRHCCAMPPLPKGEAEA